MHPKKDFDFRFNQAGSNVEEMFELCREAVALTAYWKREKTEASSKKGRKKAGLGRRKCTLPSAW